MPASSACGRRALLAEGQIGIGGAAAEPISELVLADRAEAPSDLL